MTSPSVDKITIILPSNTRSRTLGYADLLIGGHILIRSYRVVDDGGRPSVRVPDRAMNRTCPQCGQFCAASYQYCPSCGGDIGPDPHVARTAVGKPKWTTSVIYSTDRKWTDTVTAIVLAAYENAIRRLPVLTTTYDIAQTPNGWELKDSSLTVGGTIPRPDAAGKLKTG